MPEFGEIVRNGENGAQQIEAFGAYWRRGFKVMEDAEPGVLSDVEIAGHDHVITPAGEPKRAIRGKAWEELSEEDRVILSKSYQLAAPVNGEKQIEHGTMYLIINGDKDNASLVLVEGARGLMTIAGTFPEEVDGTDKYLPSILESISSTVNANSDDLRRERQRQQDNQRRVRRRIAAAVTSIVTIASAVGGGFAYWDWREDQQEAADEAQRAAFDETDFDLSGPVLTYAEGDMISAISSDPSLFVTEIPKPDDEDTFANPRRRELSFDEDSSCYGITSISPDTEGVRTVTDAPDGELAAVVSVDGEVSVCYVKEVKDAQETYDYNVAVQVVPSETDGRTDG